MSDIEYQPKLEKLNFQPCSNLREYISNQPAPIVIDGVEMNDDLRKFKNLIKSEKYYGQIYYVKSEQLDHDLASLLIEYINLYRKLPNYTKSFPNITSNSENRKGYIYLGIGRKYQPKKTINPPKRIPQKCLLDLVDNPTESKTLKVPETLKVPDTTISSIVKKEPGKKEPGKKEPGKKEPGKNKPCKNKPCKNKPKAKSSRQLAMEEEQLEWEQSLVCQEFRQKYPNYDAISD